MPRCFSISIQSDVAWREALRPFTAPAIWIAPENSSSFSVSVVLPASGWEMMAKVRRRRVSAAKGWADTGERLSMSCKALQPTPYCRRWVYLAEMAKAEDSIELQVDGHSVTVSHPGKVLFPEAGLTKLDLVQYYLAVADGALRGAGGRPCVMVRYPEGVGGEFFFQKRAPANR